MSPNHSRPWHTWPKEDHGDCQRLGNCTCPTTYPLQGKAVAVQRLIQALRNLFSEKDTHIRQLGMSPFEGRLGQTHNQVNRHHVCR